MTDTLYFDGKCSLCLREIGHLRRLADAALELRDIHQLSPGADVPPRLTLLRTLHLRRADGEWVTGLDASVAAWQHTRLGPLWRWLRWPLVKPLAAYGYRLWAQWRFRRLYACDQGGYCETGQE